MVLEDRPHLFFGQGCSRRIVNKDIRVQVAQAMIGADPNVAVTVLDQGASAEISETVPFLVVLRLVACNAAYSFVGCDPHSAISALQECAHEVVYQSARRRVVDHTRSGQTVDPTAVGTEPEISGTVAEKRP